MRAQRGINFHIGVRGWLDMGVIRAQFNAAPKIIALIVSNIIGMEQFSSLSFR